MESQPIELEPIVSWGTGRGRIAIAGAGAGIVERCHIPSYRRLGINIDLLFDLDPVRLQAAVEAVEKSSGTTRSVDDQEAFLAAVRDSNLDLLDVAVPSPMHTAFLDGIFDDLGSACPDLMVQKPLAESAEVAQRLVTRAQDLGVRLFMQMNGRWVPTFRKLRDAVHSGSLGEIHVVQVLNRGLNPKTPEEWRSHLDRLIGYEMAIHHVDLLVWLFGLPDWVFATYRSVPGFVVKADNFAVMTMGFGEKLVANVVEDWTCHVEAAWHLHPREEQIVVTGTMGTAFVTPHALTITADGETQTYANQAPWFPDAFGGPMEEALNARREGRASDIEGAKHVGLLNVLDSLYRSAAEKNVVEIAKVQFLPPESGEG